MTIARPRGESSSFAVLSIVFSTAGVTGATVTALDIAACALAYAATWIGLRTV